MLLVGQRAHLLVSGEIERQHRSLTGDDRPQPNQPVIATAVAPR